MNATEIATDQPIIEAAVDILFTSESRWTLVAANRWNGTDLHVRSGHTLRITREDPGGDYWIGTLTRNGICERYATVSATVSPDALATIAGALWIS